MNIKDIRTDKLAEKGKNKAYRGEETGKEP